MEKGSDFEIQDLGAASIETKGMPSGSTEQVGMLKPNGILDED